MLKLLSYMNCVRKFGEFLLVDRFFSLKHAIIFALLRQSSYLDLECPSLSMQMLHIGESGVCYLFTLWPLQQSTATYYLFTIQSGEISFHVSDTFSFYGIEIF